MIDFNVKSLALKAKSIVDSIEKARRKILTEGGYKVQQNAKSSLVFKAQIRKPRLSKNRFKRQRQMTEWIAQKKANASSPGKPPFVRRKLYPNLRSVIYVYNPDTASVLVGPVERRQRSSSKPSPFTNEFGGKVTINVKTKKGVKPMTANYKPRPVMGPALTKTLPEIPKLISNSVVGP